ncbi:MAG: Ig-like domain-containing protein [Acidobacteria bacterium]|nr:Ig-like domain-containing protein [Acidobacteriota bacterium]
MHVFRRKLGLISALPILAFSGGCSGFFVSPTLSSIAVGPTATIVQNRTVQMIATGTFTDGTTSSSVKNLFWQSSDSTVATVSSTGLVTGVGQGQATITAASGSVSGTATVTVTLGNITSITVKAINPAGTTMVMAGNTVQFQALANTAGGQTNVDVTATVTWAVQAGNITGASITQGTGGGVLSTTSSGGTGPITVTATENGITAQYNIAITP